MEVTPQTGAVAGHRIELVATILLGAATVLIAFVSFRVALIDDDVAGNFHNAVITNGEANDRFSEFDTALTLEHNLFIDWLIASTSKNGPTADRLYDAMDAGLQEAVDAWIPVQDKWATPFDLDISPLYSTEFLDEARDLIEDATAFEAKARDADRKGDFVGLSQILFAITMFSAGLSVIIKTPSLKWAVIAIASGGLATGAVIYAIGESM